MGQDQGADTPTHTIHVNRGTLADPQHTAFGLLRPLPQASSAAAAPARLHQPASEQQVLDRMACTGTKSATASLLSNRQARQWHSRKLVLLRSTRKQYATDAAAAVMPAVQVRNMPLRREPAATAFWDTQNLVTSIQLPWAPHPARCLRQQHDDPTREPAKTSN